MLKACICLLAGFLFLVKGADFFVDGASSIAKRLRIPSLIIGLTIVAFGTSAPELAVSVTASLKNSNDIAIGNVVGSNVFNLLVVIGISALICPLKVKESIIKKDYPLSIAAAILLGFLSMDQIFRGTDSMTLGRMDGIVLLLGFALFMYMTVKAGLKGRQDMEAAKPEEIKYSMGVSILVSIIGLAGIILGGDMTVNSAKEIARAFGMSEALIGLTIVAVGTSLPELVTSVVAARKGESDISIGNVVGSNLFNIFLILGTSAAISPMTVTSTYLYDIGFMILVSIAVYIPILITKKVGKVTGGAMVAAYAAYMAYLIMR